MAVKKSRLSKVADAVESAASITAQVADEYVVEPVGKALGLITKKTPLKNKSARKADRKAALARAKTQRTKRTKAK